MRLLHHRRPGATDDEPVAPAGDGEERPEVLPEHITRVHRRDAAPEGTDRRTGAWPTLKRTFTEAQEDGLTDWAAALTYYGLLAVFPGLIALVSIIGLVADPAATTRTLTDIVSRLAPGSAADTFAGPIESVTANRGRAGLLLIFGIGAALWSASGYIGALTRAANAIYETPEGRPFWKLRPLQLGITLALVLMAIVLLSATVLTGPVVEAIAKPLGIGQTALDVWDIAKWPVMAVLALAMISFLYYTTPNVRLPKFKLITPGAVFALTVWVLASALFALYVANFGSYDKTYGSLGGVISLLVWMWLSNCALLLGIQLNAEIERSRELAAGIEDAAYEIQLDARDEPGDQRTT